MKYYRVDLFFTAMDENEEPDYAKLEHQDTFYITFDVYHYMNYLAAIYNKKTTDTITVKGFFDKQVTDEIVKSAIKNSSELHEHFTKSCYDCFTDVVDKHMKE